MSIETLSSEWTQQQQLSRRHMVSTLCFSAVCQSNHIQTSRESCSAKVAAEATNPMAAKTHKSNTLGPVLWTGLFLHPASPSEPRRQQPIIIHLGSENDKYSEYSLFSNQHSPIGSPPQNKHRAPAMTRSPAMPWGPKTSKDT